MKSILVLHAHPAPRHSKANKGLASVAQQTEGVTFVDLYARYPRHKIDVENEQAQLLAHDIIIFQFPLLWYSTPSLLKEWQDLVLEYGFAYGEGGNELAGKCLLPIVTAGGAQDAYQADGYNNFDLPTFLTPLEQAARLCSMRYLPPFALFSSLRAQADGRLDKHVGQYKQLLEALRDETFDYETAAAQHLLSAEELPIAAGTE